MTDISDLREGDEIEVVLRMRYNPSDGQYLPFRSSLNRDSYYGPLVLRDATSVTVVRPEIIPGQPYVDADGKLYIGRSQGRLVHINDSSSPEWYGPSEPSPLPAGLRPAKVVPE